MPKQPEHLDPKERAREKNFLATRTHARSRQARRAATSFGVRMVTSRFRTFA
jgi:hypothetical protein